MKHHIRFGKKQKQTKKTKQLTHFDTKYGNMEKKEDNFALKQRKSQLILYTRREEAKKKKK